jgi:hypothetical protein
MATVHAPVSDMLVTVKSRELQRGMLADDYMQAGQADLAWRSQVSVASCFWRAGCPEHARALFATLLQEQPHQAPIIRQLTADLEHDDPLRRAEV